MPHQHKKFKNIKQVPPAVIGPLVLLVVDEVIDEDVLLDVGEEVLLVVDEDPG